MDVDDKRIEYAVNNTEILRRPKQNLATFGTTNIYYYLVTEPVYAELMEHVAETVVREGKVIAERPRIVTPYYLSRLDGFSQNARQYFKMLLSEYGAHAPGLFYTYRNEPKELTIVSNSLPEVVDKLNTDIDKSGDPLTTIIKGEDQLWDVSLLKFIHDMTRSSLSNNLTQMGSRGLLNVDSGGIPVDARVRIEEMFSRVMRGEAEPYELKDELHRWDLFDEYEDRFLALFKKGRRE
ncbi:MAG TPA: hypothetical protein G4O09_07100 [Dehalococcoidia bacterium]|nr:hypothetical protein [Dehalococcoidia bacterium]